MSTNQTHGFGQRFLAQLSLWFNPTDTRPGHPFAPQFDDIPVHVVFNPESEIVILTTNNVDSGAGVGQLSL